MTRRIIATALHVTLLLVALAAMLPASTFPVAAQGSASITILLRGCPDGVDPQAIANPAAECTVPLDAPDEAGVFWGGDGQGGMPLADTERLNNGTYTMLAPAGMSIQLFGFDPTVYDAYVVLGTDGQIDNEPMVILAPNETRTVEIYYVHH